jgi:thymidylate synthase
MKIFKGKTFADVYKASLRDLLENAEYETSPRGLAIRENTNCSLVIEDPTQCLYTNTRRPSQFKYIAAELLWYFTGRNDLEFIEKYAAFWRQIANEDGSLNSAYGNLLFTTKNEHGYNQWTWAMESLIKDKDTRQALMTFNRPSYQYDNNKDFICTLNGIFNIRNNKLNLTINMRSNDAILGAPTDISFFCLLLQQAHILLKKTYPDLELGSYTHIANSYHIYDRHFKLVEDMLKDNFEPESFAPIGTNFINIDGQRTMELDNLMDAVEENLPYTTSDSLFKWIFYQCSELVPNI